MVLHPRAPDTPPHGAHAQFRVQGFRVNGKEHGNYSILGRYRDYVGLGFRGLGFKYSGLRD